jgi:UDP-GlcNAc:undecaprenyl-phosphate GlcNAc-1-phosphate transferase
MDLLLTFVIAMVVTMALIPPLMHLAVRWRIVDLPAARKVHTQPIPRVGGIAMAAGLLLAVLLNADLGQAESAYLLAAGTLLLFGVADDRFDLDYRIKFLGQLLAAGIVIVAGHVTIASITLNERMLLPDWCALPLTLVFLLGITNAINLADGLDGLAGGTTFLCLAALGLLARADGLVGPTALALGAAGAVLGFLRYNTYPARLFMGDAGSQLLGFTVGVLGIMITQSSGSVVSSALPVLLAGIPILDTLSVMVQRLSERRPLFGADKNHLHHKLLALGFDHREAVTTIYAGQALLFVAAYLLRYESDLLILAAYLGFSAAVIGAMQWAARSGWLLRDAAKAGHGGRLSRLVDALRKPDNLPLWSTRAIALGLPAYAVLVMAQTPEVSGDFRILALGLLIASLVALAALRSRALSLAEKAVLYVLAALLVYLDTTMDSTHRWLPGLDWALPLGLALITALRLQMSSDRRFELTPLDLIVVFVALVVPNLPGLLDLPAGAPLGIAKIVALFYAIELLVGSSERGALGVRLATVGLLAVLILRPLLALA